MRLGVDIGGTFTDIVLDDGGTLRSWKVASTPPDFGQGVLNGVDLAASESGTDRPALLSQVSDFIHGTTATTNVVLTRNGERIGVITTKGFADTYRLARQYRGDERDPSKVTHPVPLASDEDIGVVTERVDYGGRIVTPLDEVELEKAVQDLLDKGVRSFAICFLWSFRNAEHERRAKQVIERLAPDAYVSASFEACPVAGEYERTSTTAINAYAGPALQRYAGALDAELRREGLRQSILVMKSDGGPASIANAVTSASQTVYSGPAAGVVASRQLGRDLDEPNLITFDMGGTSTDVAIVYDGEYRTTAMQFVDRQALATPMIDVTSVGAGGGSIGWVGAGALRTGPQSAGAIPGPACYDNGGTQPSVTDANLVLGLIDPEYFLGGRMPLRRDLAEHVVDGLARELGLDRDETAFGMFRVVNSLMADAIRLRTVFAGFDPREFSLVSFGGAGGLHCAAVASELGIRKVVIPSMASVFSAVGLLSSDLTYSYSKSTVKGVSPDGEISTDDLTDINAIFEELDERAHAALGVHDIPAEDCEFTREIELSYLGQILDFSVPAPAESLTPKSLHQLIDAFHEQYTKVYGPGAASPEAGYMLKNYKVTATGRMAKPARADEIEAKRHVWEPKRRRLGLADISSGAQCELDIFDGDTATPGAELTGPAVVEFWNTTAFVPAGFSAHVDALGHMIIEAAVTDDGGR